MNLNPKNTAAALRKETSLRPALAMILGSGFQSALSQMEVAAEIPFAQLHGFPPVGVSGHAGKVVLGRFGKTPVLALKGRAHYYEGHDLERVTFPVRVLADFGIRTVLLTNAAGGINRSYRPGNFMIIEDHINLMGVNPLRGVTFPGRPRFVDLTEVYDKSLRKLLKKAGDKSKLRMQSGVYLAVAGPSYETAAEVRAFAKLGADAVGMSTVPEAIVARQCGLAVAGVSCITNYGAGLSREKLSHRDVLLIGEQSKEKMAKFLKVFAELYAETQ